MPMKKIDQLLRTVPIQLRFSEEVRQEEVPPKVQILRTGTFFDDRYGKIVIDRNLLSELKDNFEKGVRGIVPAIDYSHKSEDIAAGWIKTLELHDGENETELWAGVDWTPNGRRVLSDKEFGYLSADFHPNYSDNENPDEKFGPVLFGAGLTNRPVIKGMKSAIQLSEFVNDDNYKKENKLMSEKQKITLAEMEEKMTYQENKLAKVKSLMDEMGVDSIEELMEAIKGLKKDKEEMAEEKELAERKTKLEKLFSEGKISKAQMEEAKKLKGETFESFYKLSEMNTPMKTNETGDSGEQTNTTGKSAQDEVMELAEKKRKDDDNLGVQGAISMVLSENKELKEKYLKEIGEE